LRGSLWSRLRMALERRREGRFLLLWALFWVFFEVVPVWGGGSFTPALRAFDKPIAIACLAELAPCLPSRTW